MALGLDDYTIGALILYMDIIMIFLYILQMMSRKRWMIVYEKYLNLWHSDYIQNFINEFDKFFEIISNFLANVKKGES